MNKNLLSVIVLVMATCFLCLGAFCDTGSGVQLLILGDQGNLQAPPSVNADGEIFFTAALVSIRDIEFKQKSDEGSGKIEFVGPFIIDLLDGTGIPLDQECITEQPDFLPIEGGEFDQIDFRAEKNGDIAETCPIFDQAVYAAGKVECAGELIEFVFYDDKTEDFRIDGKEPVVLGEEGIDNILLIFHLDEWFSGVNLCQAEILDGVITVSDDFNTELKKVMKVNIATSADAGKDKDGDKKLDEEESIEE